MRRWVLRLRNKKGEYADLTGKGGGVFLELHIGRSRNEMAGRHAHASGGNGTRLRADAYVRSRFSASNQGCWTARADRDAGALSLRRWEIGRRIRLDRGFGASIAAVSIQIAQVSTNGGDQQECKDYDCPIDVVEPRRIRFIARRIAETDSDSDDEGNRGNACKHERRGRLGTRATHEWHCNACEPNGANKTVIFEARCFVEYHSARQVVGISTEHVYPCSSVLSVVALRHSTTPHFPA
jgi:hypothetical protein